jgi:hypothetical protein
MPVDNKIGAEAFIHLRGQPLSIAQQAEIYTRAGVNGTQCVTTSERGTPFTMESLVDCADLTAAHNKFRTYQAMIGKSFPEFVQHAVDIAANDNAEVLVLDVRKKLVKSCAVCVGGFNTSSEALLWCDWDLVLVTNNE